jgi:GGDEF domain-containing protein
MTTLRDLKSFGEPGTLVYLADCVELMRLMPLGHDAGNSLLIDLAVRLEVSVRPGDTVGRIFGDEFAILLEAPAGVEDARRVVERIEESLQVPFDVDG